MGNNGNWWSSTENSSTNAWNRNLNYNNTNVNRNNNNKDYGFSVRCVRDLMENIYQGSMICCPGFEFNTMKQLNLFNLNDEDILLNDIFQAYFNARENKRNTINQLAFEKHLESNLFSLSNEIIERNYEPKPSICFMVNQPVKREIFAADFRDRVVHHFIYNYIMPFFEKSFIHDSYSCRVGKGTHYGIKRIDKFIRSCSQNYKKDCYILKLDIKGYFMAMNKTILFNEVKNGLLNYKHKIDFDLPLMLHLIEKTIFNDPTKNCIIKGKKADWQGLPKSKSLFHAKRNCGLPIGNLTSQLFGNVYLNRFDHFMKSDLELQYYGRYVDDFVIVHRDKSYLKSIIPKIAEFLESQLKLVLHPDKIYFQHYTKGVKYLGSVIKPHRIYIANRTKGNFYKKIEEHNKIARDHKPSEEEKEAFLSSMNSYLGIMKPCKDDKQVKLYKTYTLRKNMLKRNISGWWENYFTIGKNYEKLERKHKIIKKL
jgi:hypothetical protein